MDAAGDHGRRKMMRTGDHVGDDFGILGIGDARLEHANDGRRPITDATEANGFADDRRILSKSGRPETVRKNNPARSFRTVVSRSDEAAEHGTKTHHVKIRAADNATSNGTRLTEADHGEVHGGEVAKRAQGFHARAQILYLRYGKRRVFVVDAGGALSDVDQAVLVAVDKRLEQDSAHERENGSVRTDAERQRENHGGRQPWS